VDAVLQGEHATDGIGELNMWSYVHCYGIMYCVISRQLNIPFDYFQ